MHRSFYGSEIFLGMMQGRLSHKPSMPLQSFPEHKWEKEFISAADIGYDSIEWLLDGGLGNELIKNTAGQEKINTLSIQSKISVLSACLHSMIDGKIFSKLNQDIIIRDCIELINCSAKIGCNRFVLPLMDKSSIIETKRQEHFVSIMNEILSSTEQSIHLAIESELPAEQILKLANQINDSRFGVVVDVGNITALNLNASTEINLLSPIIQEIHIKDRKMDGGPTFRLGMGQTPFMDIAESLMNINWGGLMVLETPIFENWIDEAKLNYTFICNLLGLKKIVQ